MLSSDIIYSWVVSRDCVYFYCFFFCMISVSVAIFVSMVYVCTILESQFDVEVQSLLNLNIEYILFTTVSTIIIITYYYNIKYSVWRFGTGYELQDIFCMPFFPVTFCTILWSSAVYYLLILKLQHWFVINGKLSWDERIVDIISAIALHSMWCEKWEAFLSKKSRNSSNYLRDSLIIFCLFVLHFYT